jgi:hypothetical protein
LTEAISSGTVERAAAQRVDCTDCASLEKARNVFVDRLHRAPDDFDATSGLRLVNAAIQRLPTPRQSVRGDS